MKPAERKRAQLTRDEMQHLQWLLGGLLTLVGLATVFYMDVEAWVLVGLTTAATLATMWWPRLPARLPGIAHTLTFPAIVAFFVVDLWLKAEVLPAMVRLDILLLLYRNISYRQRRDDLQIIVLGLFLVIVAGVLSVSLTFAVQILVYTGCGLALLLVVTLTEGPMGLTKPAPVPPGVVPAWVAQADLSLLARRVRAVLDWRVAGLGVGLFAGLVVISTGLFLAIPRFQLENSMFLDRFISKKARSGFSDTIRLGDVTEIQQDGGVALSVDVSDQTQIPASPYWRMLVLNQYDGGVFRASPGFRAAEFEQERTDSRLRGMARPVRGEEVVWTFYLESGVSRFLPLLGRFDTLVFREVQNFRFASRPALLALREEPVSMTAYRVSGFEVASSLPDRTFAERWRRLRNAQRTTEETQVRLTLEEPDRLALGQVLAQAAGTEPLPAGELARRLGDWLRRNHAYSLASSLPAGKGDPLVRWMRSLEPGHCELFAGSFVLLARAAGVPARAVTGFRGGTWNGYSNNFTIRNADAHAWAELFDEATGAWVRADPLAERGNNPAEQVRGEPAAVARVDRSWTARFDSLRVFWYRRIVNFDQRSQAETLKAVKQATETSGRQVREFFRGGVQALKAWIAGPWDVSRLVRLGAGGLGLLLTLWLVREFGGAGWRALCGGRTVRGEDPVRREAGRWLRRLAECPPVAPEEAAVVADLQRVRFGARPTWPPAERTFRRARQVLRATQRRSRVTRS